MPWDVAVDDPIAALAEARRELGDTFVVDSGDDRYLFTFSPVGVTSFYGLPEERASKGVADWRMLRRKLPDEIFEAGGRCPISSSVVTTWPTISPTSSVLSTSTVEELGGAGDFDVFDLTRRLGHRVGLASWGGPGSASGERFDRLARAFDALDGSESFVHPDAMAAVAASGKAAEHAALAVVTAELGLALDELDGNESDHASLRPGGSGMGRRARRGAGPGCCLRRGPGPRGVDVQPLRRAGVDAHRPHDSSRRARHGCARAIGPGPRCARSSRPAWPNARSWPATW